MSQSTNHLPPRNSIPFARPSIDREEIESITEVLKSGWLTTGKVTAKFEEEFADFIGARYALALNSATAGLHLSLEAIGVKEGEYVITSPFTFAATAEVIRYLGADPLFADIEEKTGNLDPKEVKKTILKNKKQIGAIIPVHFAGLPCEMEEIKEIAQKENIPIVEDAAHSFPVRVTEGKYKDKFVGTLGETGVFSFYVTKPITTAEGGMLVTDNLRIAERVKIMRLHGIDRDVFDRYTSKKASWIYDVVAPGYKYNMTDLAASIGIVQLKKANILLKKRRELAQRYIEKLSGYDFLEPPVYREDHAWHLFVILLNLEKLKISRDEFMKKLRKRGIGCSLHFIPLHIMTYYKKRYGYKREDFPVSYRRFLRSISLPLYPNLTEEEVDFISQTVIDIGKNNYITQF